VLSDPVDPLQLQKLYQRLLVLLDELKNDVDVVALEPKRLQPNAIPGPEAHH